MKYLVIILIALTSLSSCVTTNAPKKEKKAKKRLAKHLKGIQNITKEHPQLVDTFTLVVHDTMVVEEHITDTSFIIQSDTAYIDSIIESIVNDTTILTVDKIRYIRNQIIKEVLRDTIYTYTDSTVHSIFIIKDGKLYVKSTVKQKEIPYVKTTTTKLDFDCEVDKPPYKYWWFYLMLIIILFLLYINIRR
jgi:hypothetical protein